MKSSWKRTTAYMLALVLGVTSAVDGTAFTLPKIAPAVSEVYAAASPSTTQTRRRNSPSADTSTTVTNETELDAAINNGKAIIVLGKSFSCQYNKYIKDTDVTLNLNNYTLTYNGLNSFFDTKKNFIINGDGTISGGGIVVERGGSLTINSGTINCPSHIEMEENTTVTMTGGKIYGTVQVESDFRMSGGEIIGPKSSSGVSILSNGHFTMTGGSIHNSPVGVDFLDGNFKMSGGKIYDNVQGVSLYGSSSFIMTGGEITANKMGIETSSTYSGTVQLSGTPKITGNMTSDGEDYNLEWYPAFNVTIGGALNSGATVGIYSEKTGDFTKNYSTYNASDNPAKFFFSDNSDFSVSLNNTSGEAMLSSASDIIAEAVKTNDPSIITNQYSTDSQKETLAETIQNSTDVQAQIKTLENSYTASNNITVNPVSSTNDKITASAVEIIGAGLAASPNESIGLVITDADTNFKAVNTDSFENIYSFEMNLVKGDGTKVTKLDIPITITLPLPSEISHSSLRILHFLDSGKIEVITPVVVNGKAKFTITHFSTFAFANVKTTTSTGGTTTSNGRSSSSSRSSNSSSSSGGSSDSSSKVRSTGSSKAYYSKIGKTSVQYDFSALSYKAKTAKVPNTVKIGKKTYKVTAISSNAFTSYDKLTSVTIGKNVKRISKNAFSGCKKLKSITIRSKKLTAKKIKGAFNDSSITTIYVPKDKVKAYKKIFTKKNAGKKVTVKAIK